ncbi:inorganic phosphate transporter, partial [Mycolicibacter hiberniae]|nr:inorganic phosphate transporter [Mycolicibacter hiberniae]
IIFALLVVLSGYMWWRAQQEKVDSSNVNADWDDSTNSVVPAGDREAEVGASAEVSDKDASKKSSANDTASV